MALPPMTPEQRAAGLEKAKAANAERARVKDDLKNRVITIADVIAAADGSDVIGRMKVSAVLQALPGIGKARAAAAMSTLGIDPARRLRGLGDRQRAGLGELFAPEGA
jgi:hypothetical protein